MLYLLDANVLIDANRDYYPIGRVNEYWDWLVYQGEQGNVTMPEEVYEEIRDGKRDKDVLADWAKQAETEAALKFAEEVDIDLMRKVTDEGYASDLNDIEVEKIGRDPFLVAYALADPGERCVVTTEVSKPTRQRANRHLPDVCAQFGVPTCNAFALIKDLDFRTDWNR